MDNSTMSTSFIEIVAGTNNKASRLYIEAAKQVDTDSSKSMAYIKNFITSIENIASKDKVKDARITKSHGNISNFDGYDNIKTAIEFLQKNLGKIPEIKNLVTIYESLMKFQPQYTDGYNKNLRLIILEYECGVYLLVTGLSALMANTIDVVQTGDAIKIQKKNEKSAANTMKIIEDFAKQVNAKEHKSYLEEMIKNKDSVPIKTNIEESVSFLESAISDTVELIDTMITSVGRIASTSKRVILAVKNSIFGIVPLIRSVLYLRYKKKADTVLALDQQVKFIQMNIEQLQNKKNMDPKKKAEVISKQKAVAEAYKKKAAKLRAELTEGEREAVTAIKQEDPKIKNTDDDFVLEGVSLSKMFEDEDSLLNLNESTKLLGEEDMPADVKERYHEYDEIEKELKVTIPINIKLGVALKSPIFYRYGSEDLPVDIINKSKIKSISEKINKDLESRENVKDYSKYLPVVAITAIGNGDFDVIASNGKMMYYSHDGKNALSSHGFKNDDPELFFFVDSTQVKYDKDKKPTYVGKTNKKGDDNK